MDQNKQRLEACHQTPTSFLASCIMLYLSSARLTEGSNSNVQATLSCRPKRWLVKQKLFLYSTYQYMIELG